jgi:hypothetical protein
MSIVTIPNACIVAQQNAIQVTLKQMAVAQAVSRRPLTAESRDRARVNPRGICGGLSGTGTGFSPSSWFCPVNLSFHRRYPYSYIIWVMNNISLTGSSSEM